MRRASPSLVGVASKHKVFSAGNCSAIGAVVLAHLATNVTERREIFVKNFFTATWSLRSACGQAHNRAANNDLIATLRSCVRPLHPA